MQAASDIFLGWCPAVGLDGRAARLLRAPALGLEGLGRGRAADPARARALRAAVRLDAGPRPRPLRRPRRDRRLPRRRRRFDQAIAEFAESYADQNERDHAALVGGDRFRPRRGRGALSMARKAGAGAAGLILLTLCARAVPDDARQLGDERLDRDRRQGRRHDGHRHPDRDHALHAGDGVADDHRRQDRRRSSAASARSRSAA